MWASSLLLSQRPMASLETSTRNGSCWSSPSPDHHNVAVYLTEIAQTYQKLGNLVRRDELLERARRIEEAVRAAGNTDGVTGSGYLSSQGHGSSSGGCGLATTTVGPAGILCGRPDTKVDASQGHGHAFPGDAAARHADGARWPFSSWLFAPLRTSLQGALVFCPKRCSRRAMEARLVGSGGAAQRQQPL
mmetsp:Transcript_80525/g.260856  ORF Transcript_80525/g.260856 Transcript_80525/m.260856 type:complete len:190 (+) Transcript_80525:1603-2172(+)